MDPVNVYVPRYVQNGSENLGLKALEDFDVGIGACLPQPYSIGPTSNYILVNNRMQK
jgi:hypothetical protein